MASVAQNAMTHSSELAAKTPTRSPGRTPCSARRMRDRLPTAAMWLPIRQPALAVRKVFAVGVVRGRRAQQIEDRGLADLEDRHALREDVVLDHLEQPARADERAPEFGVDGQRERVSNELGKHS